jgi:hypothetical protein
MRQQPWRWRSAGVFLLLFLISLGLGALFKVWTRDGSLSGLSDLAGRTPSVSAPPRSPGTTRPAGSESVKAFAEVDGRLYRIIVAPRPALERRALLWSAAVTDDHTPR